MQYGWILHKIWMDKKDLRKLCHIHGVHEIKRKVAQSKASKKQSIEPKVSEHGRREASRAKDLIHKLTTQLSRMFPNAVHGFENLEKSGMYTRRKKHNRDVTKQNWKMIVQYMGYKARVKLVNPYKTSSTCPMCGGEIVKLRKGRVVKCRECRLTLDRQLCGAINIYLRMCGFPQSPSTFYRVVIKKMIPSGRCR